MEAPREDEVAAAEEFAEAIGVPGKTREGQVYGKMLSKRGLKKLGGKMAEQSQMRWGEQRNYRQLCCGPCCSQKACGSP